MITPARTGREVSRRQIPFKGGALDTGREGKLEAQSFPSRGSRVFAGAKGKSLPDCKRPSLYQIIICNY